jgi:DNA-binding NarL/FixJ family response regulator
LAPAATAVVFPPRSAPSTKDHHSGLPDAEFGDAATMSSTMGTVAAVYGMLSTNPPTIAEPKSSTVDARSSCCPIVSAALRRGERVPTTVLTEREDQVLKLIAEGSSSKEIGAALTISVKTVERHRRCRWS